MLDFQTADGRLDIWEVFSRHRNNYNKTLELEKYPYSNKYLLMDIRLHTGLFFCTNIQQKKLVGMWVQAAFSQMSRK